MSYDEMMRKIVDASGTFPRELLHMIDEGDRHDDHVGMTNPNREEFEARIETVEARMDTRVAKIESKIDQYIAVSMERDTGRERTQVERDKRIDMLVESAVKSAEKAGNITINTWLAALSIIVAIGGTYFAMQANTQGYMQSLMAAFQQGQSTPAKK